MNYLDANFAAALHFQIRGQTELAQKFMRKNSLPFLLSELAALECRRAFLLRTGKANSENWARLESFVTGGTWRQERVDWSALVEKSKQLIDRFGTRLKAGTLDTLHVAHALHSGCTHFLSFDNDSNARVLAVSCRLRVFPGLTPEERGRVVH